MQQMLPSIRSMSGDAYVFQQDSAPAHHARRTVELLQRETPKFTAPDLWPPNSPDLNRVDVVVKSELFELYYWLELYELYYKK